MFADAQRELIADTNTTWVIEGNYVSTLPIRLAAADTVVLLDLPAWACLMGVAQRHLRWSGGQRRETGVFNRISWPFIRYILTYRRHKLPRVHTAIGAYAQSAEVIVIRTRRDTRVLARELIQ